MSEDFEVQSKELKSCPFCGGVKAYATSYHDGGEKFVGDVTCHGCGAKVIKFLEYSPNLDDDGEPEDVWEEILWDEILEEARNMAIDAWNTRAYEEE